MLFAARDFSCKPTDLYDMPMFWIEWNFIVNRALAKAQKKAQERADALAAARRG
jgi:hypothetical protein